MGDLPSGTVTFLFSDIEGSTRLLQRLGDRWEEVLSTHNAILRRAFDDAAGKEVDRQGDAFFAVFASARHAVAAAATAQRALATHGWPDGVDVRVRMGIHTGEPAMGEEGYLGLDVVRGARICSAAHGGQVLVSEATRVLIGRERLDGIELRDLGEHYLKDLDHPERIFQLVLSDLPQAFPEPRSVGPKGESLPLPAFDWEGRERELAVDAIKAFRQIDLGVLDRLGPRIERQVEEALRSAGVRDRERVATELTQAAEALKKVGGLHGAAALGILGLVFLALLVLGIVALVVWML